MSPHTTTEVLIQRTMAPVSTGEEVSQGRGVRGSDSWVEQMVNIIPTGVKSSEM